MNTLFSRLTCVLLGFGINLPAIATAANRCQTHFTKGGSSTATQAPIRPFYKSTIQGVIVTPQSLVGASLGAMATVMANADHMDEVFMNEMYSRDILPYDENPQFRSFVTAANNQHARPKMNGARDRARIIDLEKVAEEERDFTILRVDSKMRTRFIEIYNHSLGQILRNLNRMMFVLTGGRIPVDDLGYLIEIYPLETGSSQTRIIGLFNDLYSEAQAEPRAIEQMKVIGEIADEYFRGPFLKNREVYQNSLIELVRSFPDHRSKERKIASLRREMEISYDVVFGLYPKLREHFSPALAFQIGLVMTENFFPPKSATLPPKDQSTVSSLKPGGGSLLARRMELHGESDSILREIVTDLVSSDIVAVFHSVYALKDSADFRRLNAKTYTDLRTEVTTFLHSWSQHLLFYNFRPFNLIESPQESFRLEQFEELFDAHARGEDLSLFRFPVSESLLQTLLKERVGSRQ